MLTYVMNGLLDQYLNYKNLADGAVAPVDCRREVSRGQASWCGHLHREQARERKRERPDERIDELEVFDAVDRARQAGLRSDRRRIVDIELLVIECVDRPSSEDGDEHLAREEAGRDRRHQAARVVVQRVGAGAAVEDERRADRDTRPLTFVTSSSVPPTSEVSTPDGVAVNATILSPSVGVLNARVARLVVAIGMLTTPIDAQRCTRERCIEDDVRSCWRRSSSRRSAAPRPGYWRTGCVARPRTVGPSWAVND